MAYQFSCSDAGATCGWKTSAGSEQELLEKVADHLKKKHKVQHVTKTLQNYAVRVAKS